MATNTNRIAFGRALNQRLRPHLFRHPTRANRTRLNRTNINQATSTNSITVPRLRRISNHRMNTMLIISAGRIHVRPFRPTISGRRQHTRTHRTLNRPTIAANKNSSRTVSTFLRRRPRMTTLLIQIVIKVTRGRTMTVALTMILSTPNRLYRMQI